MPEPTPPTDTPVVQPKTAPDIDTALDQHLDATPGATPPPAPTWRDVELGDDAPENFRKKKVADLVTSWEHGQQAVQRFQSEADRARAENQRLQTELAAQRAAQNTVRELLQPAPQQVQEDPRYAKLNELMWTDAAEYHKLRDQLENERLQKILNTEREKIRNEVTAERVTADTQRAGQQAWSLAQSHLRMAGVPDEALFDRRNVAAVYAALTLPSVEGAPNPYGVGANFDPSKIVQGWRDLLPHTFQTAAAAPAPASITIPSPTTPPGGARPAPAVTPPPPRSESGKPMSNELRAVMESFSEEMGKPKDHLIKKARGAA